MSDIDVDALITEAMNHVAQINLYEWENGDVQEVVRWVAARVEQDVRRQIAEDLMECAAKADASRRATFFETSQTRLAQMSETYRIAAQVARGGSDVG